jgi:predicted nucleotidyltransferase
MQISKENMAIIIAILSKYPYQFYLFGSRATGKARSFSDVDICYKEEIPAEIIARIAAEFDDSDLPFKVDIVGFANMDEPFKERIQQEMVAIKP